MFKVGLKEYSGNVRLSLKKVTSRNFTTIKYLPDITTIREERRFILRRNEASFSTSSVTHNDPFGSPFGSFPNTPLPVTRPNQGFTRGLQDSDSFKSEGPLRENSQTKTELKSLIGQETQIPQADFVDKEKVETASETNKSKAASWRLDKTTIQKLVDGIDEHGEDWEFLSTEVFNGNISPHSLENKWTFLRKKYPPKIQSPSRVYPYWTTKETEKLISAIDLHGVEWDKISIEVFNRTRSPRQCRSKWDNLQKKPFFQEERLEPDGKPTKALKREVSLRKENNHEPPALGGILQDQWSKVAYALGRRFVKLEINFVSPQELPWTREENIILFKVIKEHGINWDEISKAIPKRSVESVRERMGNTTSWTKEEVEKFEEAYNLYQNDWDRVSKHIKTKTPGLCWSYWRTITGADILEFHASEKSGSNVHRAALKATFSDSKTIELSFIRYNTVDAFVLENEVSKYKSQRES
ncbi:13549_t:CDS:2 [Acaulospora colombiana]|uniref:13549_t:CDS:1 n=1 Tax=Acaulospora colombiana TaxID=27376 RepID=A0ACA9MRH1_9GLOM|nr:13549_t:CDS:2 [Acaulospora colombiana]